MNMRNLHRGFSRAFARVSDATHRRPSIKRVHGRPDSELIAARGWRIAAAQIASPESCVSTNWQRRLLLKRGAQIYTTSIDRTDRCSIAILDARGIVIAWHDHFENAKSQDRGVVSRHMSQFYLPEDIALQLPASHLSMAIKQGVNTQIGWRRRPGGEVFWGVSILQTILLSDGELLGYSHITRSLRGPAQILSSPMRALPVQRASFAMA
jgi:hypothetical protein